MRSALVTGCAGFIGSHLTEALLRAGWRVYGVDNLSTGRQENIEELYGVEGAVNGSFKFYRADLKTLRQLPNLLETVDVVFHQAALGSVPRSVQDPESTHDHNVNSTFRVLDGIRKSKRKPRLVFASSSSVYGDEASPVKSEDMGGRALSPYAASKQVCEIYAQAFCKAYPIQCVGLRYFNVFGTRQRADSEYAAVIPKWIRAMLKKEPVTVYGLGETRRDFTPVSDVVRANLLAADLKLSDGQLEIFNVGMGCLTSLNELFSVLKDIIGYRLPVQYAAPRPNDVQISYADTHRMQFGLGLIPDMPKIADLSLSLWPMVDEAQRRLLHESSPRTDRRGHGKNAV